MSTLNGRMQVEELKKCNVSVYQVVRGVEGKHVHIHNY